MTPRDLRRLMTGLLTIEREELEAIGVLRPGKRSDGQFEEFFNRPCRAVLRLTDKQQQALIDHLFQGVTS